MCGGVFVAVEVRCKETGRQRKGDEHHGHGASCKTGPLYLGTLGWPFTLPLALLRRLFRPMKDEPSAKPLRLTRHREPSSGGRAQG